MRHRSEIKASINPSELGPHLVKLSLLSFDDLELLTSKSTKTDEKAELLLRTVETAGENAIRNFVRCLRDCRDHLGHQYAVSLLDESEPPFASNADISASSIIRGKCMAHFPEMVHGMNTPALTCHLIKERLLTNDECETLNGKENTSQRNQTLFQFLDRKGPTAYLRFASCLRDEEEHRSHQELFHLLCPCIANVGEKRALRKRKAEMSPDLYFAVKVTKCNPKAKVIKATGILIDPSYLCKVQMIQESHNNGDLAKSDQIVGECKRSGSKELYVAVLLRNCAGYITLLKKDYVEAAVEEARLICKSVSGDNQVILESRCEWTLSKLYRYLEDMKKAEEHAQKALELQDNIIPGEDTALILYEKASILLHQVSESWCDENAKLTRDYFKKASDHAALNDYGLPNYNPRIRIAQLLLRCSPHRAGECHNQGDIREASRYLQEISDFELPPRLRCLFYCTKSDLFRNTRSFLEAEKYAEMAYGLAKQHEFASEVESVMRRFHALQIHHSP